MDSLNDAIRYCRNIYKIEANDKWGHFEQIEKFLKELKEYKKLEEQHRNITLPCKVSDTLYLIEPLWLYDDERWKSEKFQPIHQLYIKEKHIDHFRINRDNRIEIVMTDNLYMSTDKFGVYLFSDLEEAKAVYEKAKEIFENNNPNINKRK